MLVECECGSVKDSERGETYFQELECKDCGEVYITAFNDKERDFLRKVFKIYGIKGDGP